MLPVIEQLAANNPNLSLEVLAWALAFGACLGGNGSLIGASANIVTVGLAGKAGHHVSFVMWLYAGDDGVGGDAAQERVRPACVHRLQLRRLPHPCPGIITPLPVYMKPSSLLCQLIQTPGSMIVMRITKWNKFHVQEKRNTGTGIGADFLSS